MEIAKLMPMNVAMPSSQAVTSSRLEKPGESFTNYLKNSISEVNELQKAADTQTKDLAVGKSENLHQAMISLEKADTALKLLVQVRNKALEAYNQIMQMQV